MLHVLFLDLIPRSEDIDRKRLVATQNYRFSYLNQIFIAELGKFTNKMEVKTTFIAKSCLQTDEFLPRIEV